MTLRLLHNDVRVTHAMTMLNMAISRTKIRNVWQKVIYFYVTINFFIANLFSTYVLFSLRRAIASVWCPSVCLSIRLMDCDHISLATWDFITQFISPVSQFFACKISAIQCKGNILKSGVEQRWGSKKWRFSTDKSSYLRKVASDH